MSSQLQMLTTGPPTLQNWVDNSVVAVNSAAPVIEVSSPANGEVIGLVPVSGQAEVDAAVKAAAIAYESWGKRTMKDRCAVLLRAYNTIQSHLPELIDLIVLEHGKNKLEAAQEIAKGCETLEWAIGQAQTPSGRIEEVSRGVECREFRRPIGVVCSIVPFNFPFMVPAWTWPIALAAGNTMVLKPSEKVPLTMSKVAELLKEAGIPDGVFNIVHGTASTVELLVSHPSIRAVTFVGTSRVAELIYRAAALTNKRAVCLGGAKNHLVASPDCNVAMTAQDIVASFSGCCGQRCMAASVLLLLSPQPKLLEQIVSVASSLVRGQDAGQLGPVIDRTSKDRILSYINDAEESGAQVLLDGRKWSRDGEGFWVGPTVLLHSNKDDPALKDEIFGPVLSVYVCKDWEEAIAIENGNPYGNAACIYTQRGDVQDFFVKRFSAGMIGVNIGVPVPREPFSFGGINKSKFGQGDITGDDGFHFFTELRKVTTKWNPPQDKTWLN